MQFAGFFITLCCLGASVGVAAVDAPPAPIVITSPLDFQVFQRQSKTTGVISLRGKASADTSDIECRITGKPMEGALDSQWLPVAIDKSSNTFSAQIPATAGGWYRLELRIVKNNQNPPAVTVEHVGVGEVFLIAGQSNSTNYGKPRQKVASGMVSTFDGKSWRIADDPQPGTQDKSSGGSFVPSFGDAMVDRYHVPIGVASVGFGGTSVREWLPKGDRMKEQPTTGKHVKPVDGEFESTGELFDGMMKRMKELGQRGFRAVLWHQGESDAGQARAGYPADRQITGDEYVAWMKRLISESQKQAGWEFPWFVAQATYHSEKDPSDAEFRAAQKSLWDNHAALPGPDTDQLRAEYRDGVHFNGKGLTAHGKLWAEKVANYLDTQLAQTPNH